jgi:hypothetical protein
MVSRCIQNIAAHRLFLRAQVAAVVRVRDWHRLEHSPVHKVVAAGVYEPRHVQDTSAPAAQKVGAAAES